MFTLYNIRREDFPFRLHLLNKRITVGGFKILIANFSENHDGNFKILRISRDNRVFRFIGKHLRGEELWYYVFYFLDFTRGLLFHLSWGSKLCIISLVNHYISHCGSWI